MKYTASSEQVHGVSYKLPSCLMYSGEVSGPVPKLFPGLPLTAAF